MIFLRKIKKGFVKGFLYCFALNCAFLIVSFSWAQTFSSVRDSVWQITLLDKYGEKISRGTVFFIGPRSFVTNFHVILPMIEEEEVVIFLDQKNNPPRKEVTRILKVSALYDLALLETESPVPSYLPTGNQLPQPTQPDEALFLSGYPLGKFQDIRKTRIFVDHEYFYYFPVNLYSLEGASGSPVVNKKEQLVGILKAGDSNFLFSIKSKYLWELLEGNTGLDCASTTMKDCLAEEIENLKEKAEQGHALAQCNLALMYHFGEGLEKDLEQAVFWYKKSAMQDYLPAKYGLANLHYYEKETEESLEQAALLYKELAEKGFAPAQYNLGNMYQLGKGKEEDLEQAVFWYKKAALQGYALAQLTLSTIH